MHPVDLYCCSTCGSLTTFPMPEAALLERCYAAYGAEGYPVHKARAKKKSSQSCWYRDVLQYCAAPSIAGARVADVGAGEGLLSSVLAERRPAAIHAFDYHACPPMLADLAAGGLLTWRSVDLASGDWVDPESYDAVFCISVIEHVRAPAALVANLCRAAKPGGRVYLVGPTVDAWAYRVMRSHWPYMIPGEHLSVPSLRGLELLCERLQQPAIRLQNIPVSYSLRYVFGALLRLPIPSWLEGIVRLPLGAFCMEIRKPPR